MPIAHPNYSDLLIYDWNKGEKPRPGAFAVVKAYKGLTHLANAAYGVPSMYPLINLNKWNMANLTYRTKSTDCNSKKVDPQSAYKNKAFIALCQADRPEWVKKLGFRYTPIWVPSDDMLLPTGKNKSPAAVIPKINPSLLHVPVLINDRKQTAPISAATANALQFAGRGTTLKVADASSSPAIIEAAMAVKAQQIVAQDRKSLNVMWIGAGLAILAVAGLMAMAPSK